MTIFALQPHLAPLSAKIRLTLTFFAALRTKKDIPRFIFIVNHFAETIRTLSRGFFFPPLVVRVLGRRRFYCFYASSFHKPLNLTAAGAGDPASAGQPLLYSPLTIFLEPEARFELAACCLRNSCSATELLRHLIGVGAREHCPACRQAGLPLLARQSLPSLRSRSYFGGVGGGGGDYSGKDTNKI